MVGPGPRQRERDVNSGSLAAVFDRLYSQANLKKLEHGIVAISALGFLAHLVHIFLALHLSNPPAIIAAAGKNYLYAIYTPFSFILFYEVLILISALPQSTSDSIATQYEIVSLIFIRGFFKDIAKMDLGLHLTSTELTPAILEACAGLLMFLLVTVFQHAASKRPRKRPGEAAALEKFSERKKMISLVLSVVFLWLAASSLWGFAFQTYREIYGGAPVLLAPPALFYSDVFTVMIFTDVLILILSLLVSDRYELVFRNAAFIISTILIRFSLTAEHPYGVLLGVSGMLFGILTILIYNYNTRISTAAHG